METINNLEFIEKKIEQNKSLLERYTNHLLAFPSLIIKIRWEEIRKEVIHLQQIKAKLEAWEVVQGTIAEGEDGDGHYCYIETTYFTGEKGEKVKKGLYNDETR